MYRIEKPTSAIALMLAAMPAVSLGSVLFQDNFSTDTSALWTTNIGGAAPVSPVVRGTADFAFDYSTYGIPAAPGSSDTLGLKLKANTFPNPTGARPAGTIGGISVSPKNPNFGTQYQVSFYAWSNFFGSQANGVVDNAGSNGGTNNVSFAIGTSGTNPEIVGSTNASNVTTSPTGVTLDGVVFATTNDGGLAQDYRVFVNSNTPATAASGVYAAGTTNDSQASPQTPMSNTNLYYQNIPTLAAHAVPESVKAKQYPMATAVVSTDTGILEGLTQVGSFGFAWHHVVLTRDGNTVTWDIDGYRIATVDASNFTLGNNFAIGQSDVNTSTAQHPDLVFTIIDNVTVTAVPEPASLGLLGIGAAALFGRRRRAA